MKKKKSFRILKNVSIKKMYRTLTFEASAPESMIFIETDMIPILFRSIERQYVFRSNFTIQIQKHDRQYDFPSSLQIYRSNPQNVNATDIQNTRVNKSYLELSLYMNQPF